SDVEDPLGLNLRGVARLGESLLNGITSVTRRARYYSFLPWCIFDHRNRANSHPSALLEATRLRETGLALACITFDRNDPKGTCKGGNGVGTIKAKHWLRKNLISADLDTLTLGESPALDIYYGSLVNLGCFISDDEMAVSEADPEAPLTFDE